MKNTTQPIWLTAFWQGIFFKITGKNVKVYSSFQDIKIDKFNETELQNELVEKDGEYEFTIFGEEYSAVEVISTFEEDLEKAKEELAEFEEMLTYFKSL